MAATKAGNQGCPCINNTGILASLTERHCLLPDGITTGIQLTLGGSCVPFTYGSSECRRHDFLYDPRCKISDGELDSDIPGYYCFRPFCYVDADTCTRDSEERVFRSSYFSTDSNVDIFYSYSTCNATADDWLAVANDIVEGSPVLGGIEILSNIPTYVFPSEIFLFLFSHHVM